ncbi:Transcriptional regulator SlyA [Methylobacterium crusticola]|uniref:Transcriptional regulator SlyA n=1 Tax=Methylobacterium crusticola TaxID=1697972 RepID=A0ABQ4R0Z1_9HYPH|nr:MarR family transcriptional regulator [Methylobacterium crusticola]GJD50780.1 Transcriptional regulator SlyA [Methylobacterium crusticola]
MDSGAENTAKEATRPIACADTLVPEAAGGAWPLSDRPGFLARRLYQIHVSLFSERCAAFRVTPLQYSLISELMVRGEADQTTLAHAVALDRTTTTGALRRLEARGFVTRTTSPVDRRSQQCCLTEQGRAIHDAMADAVRQAHEDTVAALSPAERTVFMTLMKKISGARTETDAAADLRI